MSRTLFSKNINDANDRFKELVSKKNHKKFDLLFRQFMDSLPDLFRYEIERELFKGIGNLLHYQQLKAEHELAMNSFNMNPEPVIVRGDSKDFLISPKEVLYIESKEQYKEINLVSKKRPMEGGALVKKISFHGNFNEVLEKFNEPDYFLFKVNKSYVINYRYFEFAEKNTFNLKPEFGQNLEIETGKDFDSAVYLDIKQKYDLFLKEEELTKEKLIDIDRKINELHLHYKKSGFIKND